MTVKNTIKYSILTYPMLYPNALTVYNHLFCVIGNGYNWVNGELVENTKYCKTIKSAINNVFKQFLIDDYDEDSYFMKINFPTGVFNKFIIKHNTNALKLINRILNYKILMKDFSIPNEKDDMIYKIHPFKFYELSRYSAIYNLPDDIKPDWLEASEKMYNILLNDSEFSKDNEDFLLLVGRRIERLKMNLNN